MLYRSHKVKTITSLSDLRVRNCPEGEIWAVYDHDWHGTTETQFTTCRYGPSGYYWLSRPGFAGISRPAFTTVVVYEKGE